MSLDRRVSVSNDHTAFNVVATVLQVLGHSFLGVDGKVGFALLEVGLDLQVRSLALLNGRGRAARPKAFTCVLAFALEPHSKVPIRAALVDHGLVKDGDLFVAGGIFYLVFNH